MLEEPCFKVSPQAIARGIEDLLDENERLNENNQHMQEEMARTWEKYDNLQERIDNAICILNELYDCDIKEEDYSLIYLAIKTLRGSGKE